MLIHELSQGIPRTMSVICDNALLNGFAAGRQPVSRDMVADVAKDFDLRHVPLPDLVSLEEPSEGSASAAPLLQTVEDIPRDVRTESTFEIVEAADETEHKTEDEIQDETEEDEQPRRFSMFGMGRSSR